MWKSPAQGALPGVEHGCRCGTGKKVNQDQPNWMWDGYWRADRLVSCLGEADPRDRARVDSFWRAYFEDFSSGARLLDMCCGNGIVGAIAAAGARAAGKAIEIHGIDLAAIEPARFVTSRTEDLAHIIFHGARRLEDMPFESGYFDGAASQFGLEYTDTDKSIPELFRVLAGGARVRCLIHARDGAIVAPNVAQIAQSRFILEKSGIFRKAVRAIEAAWDIEQAGGAPNRKTRARLAKAEGDFKAALKNMVDKLGGAGRQQFHLNLVTAMGDIYRARGRFPLNKLVAMVGDVEHRLRAHRGRMETLQQAARSHQACLDLATAFEAAGFKGLSVESVELDGGAEAPEGVQIGWRLEARKG